MIKEVIRLFRVRNACSHARFLFGDSFYDNIKFSALYRRFGKFNADYVYHYTSIDTFGKLINDKADLLLTRYDDLNDDSEFEYGLNRVFTHLSWQLGINGHKAALLRKKIWSRYSSGDRVPWIMSFSEANDSLYQWAMYTDRKIGGCSIGYDFREMNYQIESLKNKSKIFDFYFLPCFYSHKEIDVLWDLWETRHKDALQSIKDLDYYEVKARQDELLDPLVSELIVISAILKHPEFAAEREWRLIAMPRIENLRDEGMGPIILAGKRRLGLNACCNERVYRHEWIRGVIVSPHNREGRVERSDICSDIMRKHGHYEPYLGCGWKTYVGISDVPYNGR